MKQPQKVLITDSIHQDGLKLLSKAGLEVDYKPDIPNDLLISIISGYDILVVRSRTKVTKELMAKGSSLKVIARAGAGLDNVDCDEAKRRGIIVLNTPEAPTTSVAELTLGLVISLLRHIPYANGSMKEGLWKKKECFGSVIKGKTIGIIGFGRIGKAVAKIAKNMGMKVIINDLRANTLVNTETNLKEVSLEKLLATADVVTVHIPLSSRNRHFIGEKEFQLMKNGAFFINTSRGAVIDEKALLKALKTKKIAGAALDVFEREPPTDLSLIKQPNVICTPHIGAQTLEAQRLAAIKIAEKIIRRVKKEQ